MSSYNNILSQDDLNYINSLSEVTEAKNKLKSSDDKVSFNITLTDSIRTSLSTIGLDLKNKTTIPMRWIIGDTPEHVDHGKTEFTKTFLVFMNTSQGSFNINDVSYPITENTAYVFTNGLAHKTQNTQGARLLLGPMNEFTEPVGIPPEETVYYNRNTWYYLPIVTAPPNSTYHNDIFKTAEALLNTSSIYSKNSREQVRYNSSTDYIPIPNNNYGIVCGTRVLPKSLGTFNITIISSSFENIDCYYSETTNNSLNTTYGTISSSSPLSIYMNENTEYTIILTQQNLFINSSLLINTSYSTTLNGSIYPINSAFNGTIINNKF